MTRDDAALAASSRHAPAADFPSYRDLDGLMVFDGVCHACSSLVRFVGRVDRERTIRFAPLQSALGRRLCEREGVDPDDPSTFLFFADGTALEASDAVLAMFVRLPRPWRWLNATVVVPRSIRDAVYRWVARHRYRLFGRRQTCFIPSAALKARFVGDEGLMDEVSARVSPAS